VRNPRSLLKWTRRFRFRDSPPRPWFGPPPLYVFPPTQDCPMAASLLSNVLSLDFFLGPPMCFFSLGETVSSSKQWRPGQCIFPPFPFVQSGRRRWDAVFASKFFFFFFVPVQCFSPMAIDCRLEFEARVSKAITLHATGRRARPLPPFFRFNLLSCSEERARFPVPRVPELPCVS